VTRGRSFAIRDRTMPPPPSLDTLRACSGIGDHPPVEPAQEVTSTHNGPSAAVL